MGKLVAIGGGKNGRIKSDGTKDPYETKEIDEEIMRLSGKENPNFLFLSHAQSKPEYEVGYFETMKRIYGDMFGCTCDKVSRADLKELSREEIERKIKWADIIYVGGGDTMTMISLWKEYGIDNMLKNVYEKGTVLSGLSAGANCWFKYSSSDSLKIQLEDNTAPMIEIECLGWYDLFYTPHYDDKTEFVNREEHMKECLEKRNGFIGLGVSNLAALEIVDGTFRIIISGDTGFAEKCYFDENGNYIRKKLEIKEEYTDLYELIEK